MSTRIKVCCKNCAKFWFSEAQFESQLCLGLVHNSPRMTSYWSKNKSKNCASTIDFIGFRRFSLWNNLWRLWSGKRLVLAKIVQIICMAAYFFVSLGTKIVIFVVIIGLKIIKIYLIVIEIVQILLPYLLVIV